MSFVYKSSTAEHKNGEKFVEEEKFKQSSKAGAKEEKMVLSKMYCSEQIVIPEKISNLLKTYAKGKKMLFSFSLT